MELKRRGFRQKNYGKSFGFPKIRKSSPVILQEKYPNFAERILDSFIGTSESTWRKENWYEALSGEEKENLIRFMANQIVQAHPTVIAGILDYFTKISMDLGQKTEVMVNRIRFGIK